jgi:23S rRNA pseudouridine1911/1915/1917 synthase
MPEMMHTLVAAPGDAGQRLDKFLTGQLPDMSRSRLQGLIAQGCVRCGELPAGDANAKVQPGQVFTLTIPETVPSHILPQAMALAIVYEDEHMLVIDKPVGLTVHPAPGHYDHTLVNALLAHCGDSLSGIGGVARPGIVHRIDKDTSGLLVVAKHDTAHLALSAQLAERTLKRTYNAIAWGEPKTAQGTITGNIGRSLTNRQKMAVLRSGGKAAVTHYRKLTAFTPGELKAPIASLLECNLETGRTHQIRVHFAYIGHPLVGDQTYGQSTASRLSGGGFKTLPEATRTALLRFQRQALHARALELVHPVSGKTMHFECALPQDMKDLIAALG